MMSLRFLRTASQSAMKGILSNMLRPNARAPGELWPSVRVTLICIACEAAARALSTILSGLFESFRRVKICVDANELLNCQVHAFADSICSGVV